MNTETEEPSPEIKELQDQLYLHSYNYRIVKEDSLVVKFQEALQALHEIKTATTEFDLCDPDATINKILEIAEGVLVKYRTSGEHNVSDESG